MAKAKRVFQLARELGVESKAILEKCKAEGLELNNHMSSVSLGLEATVREWFSEGGEASEEQQSGGTAVETAKRVDLSKAKAKARPRKRAKAKEPETAEAAGPREAAGQAAATGPTAEPQAGSAAPAEGTAEAEKEPASAAPSESQVPSTSGETGATDETVAGAAAQGAEAAESPEQAEAGAAEGVEASAGTEAQASEPEVSQPAADAGAAEEGGEEQAAEQGGEAQQEAVTPAGPRLETPETAKLRGPKVVRIEAPEQQPERRRGGGGGGGGRGGPSGAPQPAGPDMLRSKGPVRGKGVGGGPESEEDRGRSPRRRRRSGRRGRSGDSDVWTKDRRREQDLIERDERLSQASGFLKRRRQDMKKRASGGQVAETPAMVGGKVAVEEPITIKDLSAATGIKGADIVKFLFHKGVMATINASIDTEAAMEICLEHDIELEVKQAQTAEEKIVEELKERERTDVRGRPPVVAVLGHVDHGKTSLLDKIRHADVAAGEAGGITQHIGAFRATIQGTDGTEKTVVFLDTPGHQAFTTMRARGATLADLVVLIVAADDGVMPQTVESIDHAKAAGIPMMVALNKVDKPEATDSNIQRILGQLAERELNPVEWGGETEVIKVSAETGEGVTDLIEVLDFQAELRELTADYGGRAYGQVIEAELDPGRGPIARVLVQEGELRIGDFIGAGRAHGKVRSMMDEHGRNLDVAGPATPVEIAGLDEVPDAGDKLYVTETQNQAEQIAEQRRDQERKEELAKKTRVSLDNVFEQMQSADVHELRVVLKADVQGSVEVLTKQLGELGNEQAKVRVLHSGVGGITESDVLLAEASDAVVIGFNVIASPQARGEAERRGVDVRNYRVIYDVVDDVNRALEGLLTPEKREEVLGHAEVRDVFRVTGVGAVAGCYVTDGVVRRNANVRVTRGGIVVEHDRTLKSLKRFKDDAKEVRAGMECGMSIEGYNDIEVGDELECYVTTEVRATLS